MQVSGHDARLGGERLLMPASRMTRRRLLVGTAAGLSAAALGVRPAFSSADPAQALVSRLCDIVMPDTDTPGARAAGVPAFLPLALSHGLFGGDADTLGNLTKQLDASAGGGFLLADTATQLAIVTALDHATFSRDPSPAAPLPAQGTTVASDVKPAQPDTQTQKLWRIVKSGIITSFYTSESGGSRTLAYDLVPGRYDSDIALSTDPYLSNAWIENIF